MSLRVRASAWALLGAGSIVLSACGSDGDASREPLEPVQPTSYVTIEPATTTTTNPASNTTAPPGGAIDPNEQTYVIQSGDSVSRIANIHGITMDQLVQYNQWPNGINHVLIPGQEVRIPPNAKVPGAATAPSGSGTSSSGSGTPPATGTAAPGDTGGEGCTHTIESGDNPSRVAEQYDISVQVLEQANAGNPAYQNFLIGSTLNIPAGADC